MSATCEPHVCKDEAVETDGGPNRHGSMLVIVECAVCGRVLDSYVDSIL
jgi:hypothetical protein